MNTRICEINNILKNSDNWQDNSKIQAIQKEKHILNNKIEDFYSLINQQNYYQELFNLAIAENNLAILSECYQEINTLYKKSNNLFIKSCMQDKLDPNDAFMDIKPGAGGIESQDWANMLFKMYYKWGLNKNFKVEIIDKVLGEVGIKSVTLKFIGNYAYGYLKGEVGIHRLVRKSPFNANHKRHTSFASVFLYPVLEDNNFIEINLKDIRIDTFKARGAGGQHVNTTDSAVRITHIPTNIVVQCQSDRSQHRNKKNALEQLKAKLYNLKLKEKKEKQGDLEDLKNDISWGKQKRSYVFDKMIIKDIISNYVSYRFQDVLEGDLDAFIENNIITKCKN